MVAPFAVYVPPLPKYRNKLKSRITYTINLITVDMLQQVFEKFEYRLDVRRANKGGTLNISEHYTKILIYSTEL